MSFLGLMWALGMCFVHISRKGSLDTKPCFVFVSLSYPTFSIYTGRFPIFPRQGGVKRKLATSSIEFDGGLGGGGENPLGIVPFSRPISYPRATLLWPSWIKYYREIMGVCNRRSNWMQAIAFPMGTWPMS
jgi:hypothetical protein